MEHLFSDALIQKMMPEFMPFKRFLSISCGIVLLAGGGMVFLGYRTKLAAIILGVFLIVVSISIHLPYVFSYPEIVPKNSEWLWDIYQRSNLVKNLCLLGVCFHLLYHEPKRFSLTDYLKKDA